MTVTHPPDGVRLAAALESRRDTAELANAEQLHLESLSATDLFRDGLTIPVAAVIGETKIFDKIDLRPVGNSLSLAGVAARVDLSSFRWSGAGHSCDLVEESEDIKSPLQSSTHAH